MTLAERARHNGVSEQEEVNRDQERCRADRARQGQQRANEKGRERRSRRSAKVRRETSRPDPWKTKDPAVSSAQ